MTTKLNIPVIGGFYDGEIVRLFNRDGGPVDVPRRFIRSSRTGPTVEYWLTTSPGLAYVADRRRVATPRETIQARRTNP